MKIKREIRGSNFFNANREKIQFRAKIGRGYTGGTFTDSTETFFVSKWSRIFQISLLIWTSKIPKMKIQTKDLGHSFSLYGPSGR